MCSLPTAKPAPTGKACGMRDRPGLQAPLGEGDDVGFGQGGQPSDGNEARFALMLLDGNQRRCAYAACLAGLVGTDIRIVNVNQIAEPISHDLIDPRDMADWCARRTGRVAGREYHGASFAGSSRKKPATRS